MFGAWVPGGPSLPPATLMEDKLLSFLFSLQDTYSGSERFYRVAKRGQDMHLDKSRLKPYDILTPILVILFNFSELPISHQ